MKVFVFSDTHWALGRIHRDVMKQLQYDVRYTDWATYSWQEFLDNYSWCDKCLTNLAAYKTLKSCYSFLDLKKCVFVSHGYPEHENMEYDASLTYGMTSDGLKSLFPSNIKPFLMPNGVDQTTFNYIPKQRQPQTLGWCGAPHVASKQVHWAHEISQKTEIPVSLATNLSYDDVKNWYNTIDIFLVTAEPNADRESGPLPAFEAIVSGVPVIGTPVGNFRHVPGPKFKTVNEAVEVINYYKENPQRLYELGVQQYDYVIKNFTYDVLASYWKHALEFS